MAKKLFSYWLLFVLLFGTISLLPTEVDARGSRSAAKRKSARGKVAKGKVAKGKVAKGKAARRTSRVSSSRGRARSSGRVASQRGGRKIAYGRRGRRSSRYVQVSRHRYVGGPASAMPSDRVREIQVALKREGYLQGEPSGQYDKATVDAMTSYQRAHNLRATGYPTAEALQTLGLNRRRPNAPQAPEENKPENSKKEDLPQSKVAPQDSEQH